MLGNQKIIEINEKVFRDVKSYLEEKERHLCLRVAILVMLESTGLKVGRRAVGKAGKFDAC